MVQGIPMISSYELKPLYGEQCKPETKPITQDDINKVILEKLETLERRINESTNVGNDAKDEKC